MPGDDTPRSQPESHAARDATEEGQLNPSTRTRSPAEAVASIPVREIFPEVSHAVLLTDSSNLYDITTKGEGQSIPPAILETVGERAFRTDSITIRTSGELEGLANSLETIHATDEEESVPVIAAPVANAPASQPGYLVIVSLESGDSITREGIEKTELLAGWVGSTLTASLHRANYRETRRALSTHEEMVEVYDSILRHDLGNHIQIITGFSDAVADLVEDEQALDYIQRMFDNAESAADLIREASDAVNILETGGELAPTPLEPALEEAISTVSGRYDSLEVTTSTDFDGQVLADENLEFVFDQVLDNAGRHSTAPITVEVFRESVPDGVVIGVRDDGSGIPDPIRDEAFGLGKHGRSNEGPGFGLGLVRAIIESYGGSVSSREPADGGTEIRLTFVSAN